jgi:hypothetical protein
MPASCRSPRLIMSSTPWTEVGCMALILRSGVSHCSSPSSSTTYSMDEGTIMSSLLVFYRVYRLEVQSVMLVFSTPLVNCCPSTFSLIPPPLPPFSKLTYSVRLWGGGGGGGGEVLSCVVEHILQEFNALFLTRFRTYKIATPPPPPNKNTSIA